MHERAGLVGAGHHAITAADADMLVHQHDTIGAFKGSAGRAHVHAGWVRAMLTHQWQEGAVFCACVLDGYLADPLRIGFWPVMFCQTVFLVAGIYAGTAVALTFIGINQHAPAHVATDRLVIGFGLGDGIQ